MNDTRKDLLRRAAEITNVQYDVYRSYERAFGPSKDHETTFRMMMEWGSYLKGFSELFEIDCLEFMEICHEAKNGAGDGGR